MATFIFLHGSFHAAWNWHKVVPILRRHGHQCVSVDLPGHGRDLLSPRKATLPANVASVVKVIDASPGRVVLVAHSRNGMVISQVAEKRPDRIEGLIYLAAYLVPNGKSMMDYAARDHASLVVQNLTPAYSHLQVAALRRLLRLPGARRVLSRVLPMTLQVHRLRPEIYTEALYHDCPEDITELANSLLQPEPNWAGFAPLKLSEKRYGRVPKVYIECTQDRAVTLTIQRIMQRDTPCDRVLSMDSGHSPFFSQPDTLVQRFEESLAVFEDVRAGRAGRVADGARAPSHSIHA